jgi:hypothetical protein
VAPIPVKLYGELTQVSEDLNAFEPSFFAHLADRSLFAAFPGLDVPLGQAHLRFPIWP